MNPRYCKYCGAKNYAMDSVCPDCEFVEKHLVDFMSSPEGIQFAQKLMKDMLPELIVEKLQ